MLQDWDLIEPEDGGYRFRVELLRQWIVQRKPIARVQGEIDYIQPAAENLFRAAYALYQGGRLKSHCRYCNRSSASIPIIKKVPSCLPRFCWLRTDCRKLDNFWRISIGTAP